MFAPPRCNPYLGEFQAYFLDSIRHSEQALRAEPIGSKQGGNGKTTRQYLLDQPVLFRAAVFGFFQGNEITGPRCSQIARLLNAGEQIFLRLGYFIAFVIGQAFEDSGDPHRATLQICSQILQGSHTQSQPQDSGLYLFFSLFHHARQTDFLLLTQ